MCENNLNKHTKFGTSEHDLEHKKWNRRSFLQALGLAGAGTMMVGGVPLSASSNSKLAAGTSGGFIKYSGYNSSKCRPNQPD